MQQPTRSGRADIQGLRALAVAAVVVNHLVGWPSGGFVGVDVFFVISGFLITGLLLRERDRTGRISFADFYRRRVRRIMPAAVLTLVVTVAASWFLLASTRFTDVLTDAVASLFFAANWRFAATGTDYFQAAGPESPLQHFWSLSVEEQFYLVWPVVLVLTIAAVNRHGSLNRRGRTSAGIAIAVLTVGSFAWALHETTASPTVAYFSTLDRAWELGLGAVLAIATPWLARVLPGWARPAASWVGLVVIVTSLFTTAEAPGFPAPGAAVGVVGAALVILGGIGVPGGSRSLLPLTNPVARYLGDTSYSIYLWHFPVIVVFGPYLAYLLGRPADDPLVLVLVVAIALVLAFASYHLVEDPIRRSNWLRPASERRATDRQGAAVGSVSARSVYRRRRRRPYVGAAVAMSATVVVVLGALAVNSLEQPGGNAVAAPAAAPTADPSASTSGTGTAQAALSAQISSALQVGSWPKLANEGDEALPGNAAKCGGPVVLPAAECTFGSPDAPHTAILVGDSIAQAYVPGFVKVFGQGDWNLRVMSMYACPFLDTAIGAKPAAAALCESRKQAEYAAIEQTKPDLVIIANTFLRGHDPDSGLTVTQDAWNQGVASMVAKVQAHTDHFVVVPPPAPDKDIEACRTPYSKPGDCVSSVSATVWPTVASAERTIVEDAGGAFLDNRDWFCDDDGRCPAFVGNLLMKKDQAHPTASYAAFISGAMLEAFRDAGVMDTDSPADGDADSPTGGATAPADGDATTAPAAG